MENQPSAPVVKSSFVNVFAWLMIVFNGFGLFVSIIQNIIFVFIFQMDEFKNAFNDMGDIPKGIPAFFLKNIRVLIPLMGLFILFAFISSIGLLKRKEWARKVFLFLLGFGIIYTIAGAIFQVIFMRSMFGGADLPSDFNFIKIFIVIFMVIFCIGFIVLFGWLFKKLSSDTIKEEFIIPETIIPVD
jgi:hypothetical protein